MSTPANGQATDQTTDQTTNETMEPVDGRDGRIVIDVPRDDDMRALGARVARLLRGGDVLLLSGPLGAGKTTFAQGIGAGLAIAEPIVSPTFTIARELDGRFADGTPAHLVHVDAYRLGGSGYAPGQDAADALLDELESLGLDEELEDPQDDTVVLMEWGEQMASALIDDRLEIHIDRSSAAAADADGDPTSAGTRIVTLVPVRGAWASRIAALRTLEPQQSEHTQHTQQSQKEQA